MKRISLLIAAILLVITPLAAHGQSKKDRPVPGKTRMKMEETIIEGKVQKPEAFWELPRKRIGHESIEQPENFVDKIVESLESEPF